MVEIAIVGKPNAGKSTFLKAATLADVKIASYPFTTIEPNIAIGYVVVDCVCKKININCGKCVNRKRFIPIKLIDVAGLVPGAHEGRGLGNKFLDDLRRSEALIHVVDASGTTNEEGNFVQGYNPLNDIEFLENEIDEWFYGILKKALEKYLKMHKHEKGTEDELINILTKQVTGLGINEKMVKEALMLLKENPNEKNLREFSSLLRKLSKPIMIAANKMDIPTSEENYNKMKEKVKYIVPCSADLEVALRLAEKNGIIEYFPGEQKFFVKKEINEIQKKALERIEDFLKKWKSTGIQECLNKTVFELLDYIVVYPVENENRFSDKKGNVLPDAFLLPKGSKPMDLAYAIHTEIGDNFICAIDAITKQRISNEQELKNNEIIKIVTR
jgi:ribosome-binding ATPase YchF (GTP1/OBG family)